MADLRYKKKKVEKVKTVKEPPRDKDALGAYPTQVHVLAQPERRYLKTTRVLAIIAIVNICILSIQVLAVYMMNPRIRTNPKFFTLDFRFQRFAPLEGFVVRRHATELLSERYITDYVIARHTVFSNLDRMERHWSSPTSIIVLFSSPVVLSTLEADKNYYRRRIRQDGLKRDVEIKWIQRMSNSWVVEFETRDTTISRPTVGKRRWRAYVRIMYDVSKTYPDKERKFLNPYGFTIIEYYLATLSTRQAQEAEQRRLKDEEEQKLMEEILNEENGK